MRKINCWEFNKCGREAGGVNSEKLGICPAALTAEADGSNRGCNGGRVCWVLAGTMCKGEIQGTFAEKLKSCIQCEFYKKVREEEGFKFDMGTDVLTRIYSPQQLAQLYEQLQYTHEHMKELESKLFCEEKLASVGRLAAGIAHEINNPLSYVMGNLVAFKDYADSFKQCLSQYIQIGELLMNDKITEAKDRLNEVEKFSKKQELDYFLGDIDSLMTQTTTGLCHIRDIVRNLKEFSKINVGSFMEVDINKELRHVLEVMGNEYLAKSDVVLNLGELPLFQCNAAQINQVFLNILQNAVQAISGKGTITIQSSATSKEIIIKISDTGMGMPEQMLLKIFDPFFSSRDVGQGTGLGLTIAKNIVNNHGGTIEVESREGAGSTFTIRLPLAMDKTLELLSKVDIP